MENSRQIACSMLLSECGICVGPTEMQAALKKDSLVCIAMVPALVLIPGSALLDSEADLRTRKHLQICSTTHVPHATKTPGKVTHETTYQSGSFVKDRIGCRTRPSRAMPSSRRLASPSCICSPAYYTRVRGCSGLLSGRGTPSQRFSVSFITRSLAKKPSNWSDSTGSYNLRPCVI